MSRQATAPLIHLDKLKVSCSTCSLSALCLPYGMDKNELEHLDEIIAHKPTLERGEAHYHAGDAHQALYAVRSGSFKTVMTTADGAEQITGFYLPGEILGLDGLGDGKHRCSAIALETASLCALNTEDFDEVWSQLPALRNQLLRLIGEEITHDHDKLLALGQLKGEERIATFLLSLGNRLHKRGFSSTQFNLPMTRHDLANYLGLAVETLSRMLSHMQEEGIISVKRRSVEILDDARIRTMAH
ncbi:unnamed protein product, partial [Cyprideis torosa]